MRVRQLLRWLAIAVAILVLVGDIFFSNQIQQFEASHPRIFQVDPSVVVAAIGIYMICDILLVFRRYRRERRNHPQLDEGD